MIKEILALFKIVCANRLLLQRYHTFWVVLSKTLTLRAHRTITVICYELIVILVVIDLSNFRLPKLLFDSPFNNILLFSIIFYWRLHICLVGLLAFQSFFYITTLWNWSILNVFCLLINYALSYNWCVFWKLAWLLIGTIYFDRIIAIFYMLSNNLLFSYFSNDLRLLVDWLAFLVLEISVYSGLTL